MVVKKSITGQNKSGLTLVHNAQSKDATVEVKADGVVLIKYSLGLTKNIGNYESMRLDVGLESSCNSSQKDDQFSQMENWVSEKLQKLSDEIDKQSGVK